MNWGEFLLPPKWVLEVLGDTGKSLVDPFPGPPRIEFGDMMCMKQLRDGWYFVGEINNHTGDAVKKVVVQLRPKPGGDPLQAREFGSKGRELPGGKCALFSVLLPEKLKETQQFDLEVLVGDRPINSRPLTIKRGGQGYEVQVKG